MDWSTQNRVRLSVLSWERISVVSDFVFLDNVSYCWFITACSLIKAKSFSSTALYSWLLLIYTSKWMPPSEHSSEKVTGGGYLNWARPHPSCLATPSLVPSLRSLQVYHICVFMHFRLGMHAIWS